MKKLFSSFAFVAGMAVAAQSGHPNDGIINVDPSTSKIEWTGRKVTGKHHGTVDIKDGSLQIKEGILLGGSFSIDMTSIKVLDLQGESAGKLERHLKSDDFFAIETFPLAKLVITEVNQKSEGIFHVKGNLTIKGSTHPVSFNSTITPVGKKYQATADITVDRSLYNVKYGSGKFFENLGDKTIYDEFDLKISLVTN
jgi:polyisoprenoid-binding protein YceI